MLSKRKSDVSLESSDDGKNEETQKLPTEIKKENLRLFLGNIEPHMDEVQLLKFI